MIPTKNVQFITGICLGVIDDQVVDAYPGDVFTLPAPVADRWIREGAAVEALDLPGPDAAKSAKDAKAAKSAKSAKDKKDA